MQVILFRKRNSKKNPNHAFSNKNLIYAINLFVEIANVIVLSKFLFRKCEIFAWQAFFDRVIFKLSANGQAAKQKIL